MVTAGVYLVCRTSPLFQAAPAVSAVVALLGAATAFVAATSALAQKDLKRVLAYSTMSQLGYMFLAAGAGAYTAAMFHLVTHAFFKALLFLAAGMVIHALHGEQDMTRMGGLRRSLPGPYGAFLIGTLAISGMPFFSGAVSKDLILESVYVSGGAAAAGLDLVAWLSAAGLWLAALATSALTAFYMFRALFLTFHGSPRQEHPDLHRPGPSMTAPAGILAILTVLGGLAFEEPLMHHLQPLLRGVEVQGLSFSVRHLAPAAALLVGALLAGAVYLWRRPSPERLERALGPVFTFLRQGWGFDALYYYTVNLPLRALAGWLQGPVEEDASRRLPTGLGQALLEFGQGLRLLQTGLVRNYALGIVLGLVLLLGYALLVIGRGS
jgi:NADH-quinone oxidoreductase subunit L